MYIIQKLPYRRCTIKVMRNVANFEKIRLEQVYVVYSFCVRMSYICSQACLQVSIYATRYLSKLGVRRTKAYQLMICGGCSTNAAAANVRFSMLLLQTGLKFAPFLTREHCGSSKWACFLLIAEIEAVYSSTVILYYERHDKE